MFIVTLREGHMTWVFSKDCGTPFLGTRVLGSPLWEMLVKGVGVKREGSGNGKKGMDVAKQCGG